MALSLKTKLFSLLDATVQPELLSPFFCQTGDTYADLRITLEARRCVNWPFQFWDFQDQCRIGKTFEAMYPVAERVYIIRAVVEVAGGCAEPIRNEVCCETGDDDFVAQQNLGFPDGGFPESEFTGTEEVEGGAHPTSEEV